MMIDVDKEVFEQNIICSHCRTKITTEKEASRGMCKKCYKQYGKILTFQEWLKENYPDTYKDMWNEYQNYIKETE